ncbi:MAG: DUF6338 family protein [Actinomycetota bacterium]|nr:DUF6338 family protein [Actinomycetota bacterium]
MEAILAFALLAGPGLIALEVMQLGRPALQPRDRGREAALYVLVNVGVWGIATLAFSSEHRVTDLIQFDPDESNEIVSIVGPLVGELLGSALALGLVLRLLSGYLQGLALQTLDDVALGSQGNPDGWQLRIAELLSPAPWDRLLLDLRRQGDAQAVHVRLNDGRDVYGVFAGHGRANWDRDGRGLLLDKELVEVGDELIEVEGSNGMYLAPEAIASVAFFSITEAKATGEGRIDSDE